MKLKVIAVIVSVLFISASTAMADAVTPTASQKFISIADIHFDPFIGCETLRQPCALIDALRKADVSAWEDIFAKKADTQPSRLFLDTNYALLKSTLSEVSVVKNKEHPQFVLILGDFLAHDYREKYRKFSGDRSAAGYQLFVKKTLQYLTKQFHQVFPNLDVYPVVGNNDAYTGDYAVVPAGAFFQDTARIWSQLMVDKKNRTQLLQNFPEAGYYAVTVPGQLSQKIIILNTVIFSTKAKGVNINATALSELHWLHEQLAEAMRHHQHVILAFHIPVGIDVYATLRNKLGGIKEFWKPVYSQAFENELQQYQSVITAILPAHIHMDALQIITLKEMADIPVSFTSSVSPVYGNNPGFKVFSYDPETFKLRNFETYFTPLNNRADHTEWNQEYNFNSIYQPTCQSCQVAEGIKNITANNVLATQYKKYYSVSNDIGTAQKSWLPYYWCDIRAVNRSKYKTCLWGE